MLAGDLISSRPLAPKLAGAPCFAVVARLLGVAALAIGNLETRIVHADAGETLTHARAPRYVETEHRRVASSPPKLRRSGTTTLRSVSSARCRRAHAPASTRR
jgi:hypothetical protein